MPPEMIREQQATEPQNVDAQPMPAPAHDLGMLKTYKFNDSDSCDSSDDQDINETGRGVGLAGDWSDWGAMKSVRQRRTDDSGVLKDDAELNGTVDAAQGKQLSGGNDGVPAVVALPQPGSLEASLQQRALGMAMANQAVKDSAAELNAVSRDSTDDKKQANQLSFEQQAGLLEVALMASKFATWMTIL